MNGGYDDGYKACPCFWGRSPGRLITRLFALLPDISGRRVLDAGCGEGKNAHALVERGAGAVVAIDCSELALRNAKAAWEGDPIQWIQTDICSFGIGDSEFDIVVAYGLLHCLRSETEIREVVRRFQRGTSIGGWHVVCALNRRRQELAAHPELHSCLLSHDAYVDMYGAWDIEEQSDEDLYEIHPHNNIPHVHSVTRLIARRPK
jgi:ubiquinone/menaquinone biosynthesis C-methylase UbiE